MSLGTVEPDSREMDDGLIGDDWYKTEMPATARGADSQRTRLPELPIK